MAGLPGLVHGTAEVDGHPFVRVGWWEQHPRSILGKVGWAVVDPTLEGSGLRFDPSQTAAFSWRTICEMLHIHLVGDALKNNIEGVVDKTKINKDNKMHTSDYHCT